MNNKGFAITTILYGIMVLFCLLLVTLLSILSAYRKAQDKLINETNGARSIIDGTAENITNGEDNSGNNNGGDSSGNNSGGDSSGSNNGGDSSGSNNGNTMYKATFKCKLNDLSYFNGSVDYFLNGSIIYLWHYNYYDICRASENVIGWNTFKNAKSIVTSYKFNNEDVTFYPVFGTDNNPTM